MKLLFIHQNMPGQFKNLAPHLARQGHEVRFLTQRTDVNLPGVERVSYAPAKPPPQEAGHRYLRLFENTVRTGQQAVRALLALRQEGYRPDMIVAHPGWGEGLFIKDVFPRSPLLSYCEYYYRSHGGDIGFDPAEPPDIDTICRTRARNAHLLLSLEACDAGVSPTHWQRDRHPEGLRDKIAVIFDGIDTDLVRPDGGAQFSLPDGSILTRSDEVITYVARNLEPYRGFPSFIRALPGLMQRRPNAKVVIVGGDEVSYGRPAPDGKTWKDHILAEVALDSRRVHFVGKLPYLQYLRLLQISSLHIYLTVPFVLSWSCFEAMSAECLVLASATPPVKELIQDGINGLTCDFFSPADIADKAAGALEMAPALQPLRTLARQTIVERYSLSRCLPQQTRLIEALAAKIQGAAG